MEFKGEKIRHVFPARAGMSLQVVLPTPCPPCVPRASGDEPGKKLRERERIECSPRERG